ncbi:MAG: PaaI family thioesterase [Dehalococcoidia bacterium]|nr:PaaI family thioesterase [Dehalococcoidia bacterium]
MDDQAAAIQATIQPFLAGTLGIRLTSVTKEGVTAELLVRDEICTVPGVCHGGALMAFADQLGAVGTSVHLPPGAGQTTIESKTNFYRPGIAGTTLTAECRPVNLGRRLHTWQTNIRGADGKLVAQVTQTQMVLEG